MASLRLPAFMMFGLLLVGYAALDLAEVVGVIDGQAIVCLDMESEESEEERETQSEKEGKTEFEALLAARHRHAVFEAQHRHDVAPPDAFQALVIARIWEPPELG